MKKGIFNVFIVAFLIPVILLGVQVVLAYENFEIEVPKKDSYTLEEFQYTKEGIVAFVENKTDFSPLGFQLDLSGNNRVPIEIPEMGFPNQFGTELRMIRQGDKNILFMNDYIDDKISLYNLSMDPGFTKLDIPFSSTHFGSNDNIDWQGNFVMIGKDSYDNHALLYLVDGVPTVVKLSDIPQIGDNTKNIRLDDNSRQNGQVPFIKVTLYDDTNVFLGLWLENGLPPVASSTDPDEVVMQFALKYYGNDTVLTNLKNTNEGGAYALTQYSWGEVTKVQSEIALIPDEEAKIVPDMTLFNPYLIYLPENRALVFSSKDANPNSGFSGYIFNGTGEIETTFSSVLDKISPDYFSNRSEIQLFGDMLYIKNENEMKGFAINLDTQTVSQFSKEVVESWVESDLGSTDPKWKQFAMSNKGGELLINFAIWLFVCIVMVTVFSKVGRKDSKIIAKGIKLPATILKVERTGTRINNDYLVKLHLSLRYEGEEKTAIAKHLVSPVNPIPIGGIINVAYDPKTNKATVLTDEDAAKMANESGAMEFAFVRIDTIQKTPYNVKNANIIVIIFNLNGQNISLPVPENPIYPYSTGEIVEITYPKHDKSNVMLASRSLKYQGRSIEYLQSVLGDRITYSAVATSLEDCNIILYNKKLLEITSTTDQNGQKLVLKNLLFVPAETQVINGMPINSSMDRIFFDQKIQLQNMKQGAGTIISVVSKDISYSNNPLVYAQIQLNDSNNLYIAEEPLSAHEIPKVGQNVWVGYDSSKKMATIIDTI